MLKQYLPNLLDMAVFGLFAVLCVLNMWLTYRYDPPFRGAKTRPRQVLVRSAGVALLGGIMAVTTAVVFESWAAGFFWSACAVLILLRGGPLRFRLVPLALLIAAATFVAMVAGMLAVQVLWFAPMLVLSGYLPRLMALLQRIHPHRPNFWLMSVPGWSAVLLAAAIADWLAAAYILKALWWSWEFVMLERFVLPRDLQWASLDAIVVQAEPVNNWGILTTYAVFNLMGVMALWARETRKNELMLWPFILVLLTPVIVVVGSLGRPGSYTISLVVALLALIGVGLGLYASGHAKRILLNE